MLHLKIIFDVSQDHHYIESYVPVDTDDFNVAVKIGNGIIQGYTYGSGFKAKITAILDHAPTTDHIKFLENDLQSAISRYSNISMATKVFSNEDMSADARS